jgi:hypothetical protein
VLGVTEDFEAFMARIVDAVGWTVDRERRVNVGTARDVPASLVRRIESDHEIDIELYRRSLEEIERRKRRQVLGPSTPAS